MNIKKQRTKNINKGFTLVETLVAISLLTISIVAPMSLTMLALSSAIYARDQITAYYLAQEGIEAVRSVRDGNILVTALGTPTPILSEGTGPGQIPSTSGTPFTIDTHTIPATMALCDSGTCRVLETDGDLYGYSSGWTNTTFTRSVSATVISQDEVRISVTVSWNTSPFNVRSFTLSDNLYAWINTGI